MKNKSIEGVIEVRGLLGDAVRELGTRIVSGEWPVGSVVTREADLVKEMDVSRSVVREAFRILGAKGMIRSRTSDGTRVQPRSEWRLLDPDLMDWRIKAGDTKSLLNDLLNVRLVLEPGVAFLATSQATEEQREAVTRAWNGKHENFADTETEAEEKRAAFIRADLEFHRALLAIAQSELLDQLFAVIEAALSLLLDLQMQARGYTKEMIGMDESHEMHKAVYEAFMARDANGAEQAMRVLIGRAISDAQEGFLLLED